jgi:hypothetical protein
MRVSVVTKRDEEYKNRTVVGVFTVHAQAMTYCDEVDPSEETHDIDEYEVDILLNQ